MKILFLAALVFALQSAYGRTCLQVLRSWGLVREPSSAGSLSPNSDHTGAIVNGVIAKHAEEIAAAYDSVATQIRNALVGAPGVTPDMDRQLFVDRISSNLRNVAFDAPEAQAGLFTQRVVITAIQEATTYWRKKK